MNHTAVIADLRREREATLRANESYADTERRHREQLDIAQQAISRGNGRIMEIDHTITALERDQLSPSATNFALLRQPAYAGGDCDCIHCRYWRKTHVVV